MNRVWWPDLTAGLAVLAAGLAEMALRGLLAGGVAPVVFLVVLGTAAAAGTVRPLPGLALAVVWLTLALQVYVSSHLLLTAPLLLTQTAVLGVLFGVARWGRPLTLLAGGASVPLGAFVVVADLTPEVMNALLGVIDVRALVSLTSRLGVRWQLAAIVIGTLVLGVPVLLGLLARVSAHAREQRAAATVELAQAEARQEQARELARLRDDQARLARDVHDVVGHSLAVILAQAESAQFLPDEDPAALKATLATVATSARTSLQDVRQVLAETRDRPGGVEMDRLIDGLRSGGHQVQAAQSGTPVPLTPDEGTVAYHVLQEMLTNALKHGRRDTPIVVRRHWTPDALTVEVRNAADPDRAAGSGRGLTGMRERLDAVGGRLTSGPDGDEFMVTATIPLEVVR